MVRVPVPERYAIHKLIVSQLRHKSSKPEKNLRQAAVLIEALVERYPGAGQTQPVLGRLWINVEPIHWIGAS
jgi:hypothetical protein